MSRLDVSSLRDKTEKPHELIHTSDGKTLFVRRWNPETPSQTSVLLLHGITGYSEPYGKIIAEEVANSGFTVFGMDLRGHGLSDGRRGDLPSKDRYIRDLKETIEVVKEKSCKLVVLGHSLGVFSAIAITNTCKDSISGLILLSAARNVRSITYPRPKPSVFLKSLLGISILRGSPLIEYRREGMTGITDPLFNFSYSSRFYNVIYGSSAIKVLGMYRTGIINSPNLNFEGKLKIPLLVGVGENDELFASESVKAFYDSIDCDDKEFLMIPGGRHAVFPRNSWGPLVNWLRKKF